MTYLSNYHTHTTFCDGGNSVSAIISAAIKKGFKSIGFSAHSMYPFASDWHLPVKNFQDYVSEIQRNKKRYSSLLDVFIGFEADFLPPLTAPDKKVYKNFSIDYLIGSVHYMPVKTGDFLFAVDESKEALAKGLELNFSGNVRNLVECYFDTVRTMVKTCDFDFVGHVDLIRKYNKSLKLFDETENWYKEQIKETAKAIADSGKMVEINTGGIARGTIDDTYPSKEFLQELFKVNVPVVISSDCHAAKFLDCEFDKAVENAKYAGYKESMHLINQDGCAIWVSKPFDE